VYDVCATTQNTKFEKYFTPKDDSLHKVWSEDFFMNPPYSEITLWMKKAYESHRKNNPCTKHHSLRKEIIQN